MDTRVITMSSQTLAIKAQRMLQKNGISARVVRLSPRQTPRGCSFGLRIGVLSVSQAAFLMANAGIAMGEIINI